MSGCFSSEVVRTETVPLLPPQYLMTKEEIPKPPKEAGPQERIKFVLETYGERGKAIKRSNDRVDILRKWVEAVRSVYGDAAHKSLSELEALKDESE